MASGPGHLGWPGLIITGDQDTANQHYRGEHYVNYEAHMFLFVKFITALFTWLMSFVILM